MQTQEAHSVTEFKIYITMAYADNLWRKGKTEEAFEVISEALALLDKLDSSVLISIPRFIAYQFMSDYYRKKGLYEETLKYETLLNDYADALHNALTPTEVEKYKGIHQLMKRYPVKNIVDTIALMVSKSLIDKDNKKAYLERLSKLDFQMFENTFKTSKAKITDVDRKYIICFAANIDPKDISLLFNVEPTSVYTVRYRIKKKLTTLEPYFHLIFPTEQP